MPASSRDLAAGGGADAWMEHVLGSRLFECTLVSFMHGTRRSLAFRGCVAFTGCPLSLVLQATRNVAGLAHT